MKYYINKTITAEFNKAVELVTEALKKEGFGVLSEIDIQQKLNEKLDVDFRKYKILGACNPPNAYEALQQEDKIGTMLPCNVIIQEVNESQVEVAAVLFEGKSPAEAMNDWMLRSLKPEWGTAWRPE